MQYVIISRKGKPTSIRSSKLRRSGSSGVPGGTPFGLRHYTNVYLVKIRLIIPITYMRYNVNQTYLFLYRSGSGEKEFSHEKKLTDEIKIKIGLKPTGNRTRFLWNRFLLHPIELMKSKSEETHW
ncbi:hypothetical protein LXL04_019869 [Taraxacum kok-saghyz]